MKRARKCEEAKKKKKEISLSGFGKKKKNLCK